VLPASLELDCILVGLGLLLRYVWGAVDRTSVEPHRHDFRGTRVLVVKLGSSDMLAGATDSSVPVDMMVGSLIEQCHSSVVGNLDEGLLPDMLDLDKKVVLEDLVGSQAVVVDDIVQGADVH
jgi:hypothetical protein